MHEEIWFCIFWSNKDFQNNRENHIGFVNNGNAVWEMEKNNLKKFYDLIQNDQPIYALPTQTLHNICNSVGRNKLFS